MANTTLTLLQTAMGNWLGNVNTTRLPDAIRTDCINAAIRFYLRQYDLRYGEVTDTFVTAASTYDYSLPTGWLRPHTLWYTHPTNSSTVFLIYREKEVFNNLFPDTSKEALPTYYTAWGANLRLGKTPDQVVTINRNYYGLLTDLASPSDSNVFTSDAWEAILFKALEIACEGYGINDRRLPQWKMLARQWGEQLVTSHARARTSGRKAQSSEPG